MAETFRIFIDESTAREVREALAEMERKAGAILAEAALEGAEVMRAEAERRAPRLTGRGAASIEKVVTKTGAQGAEVVIGPDVAQPAGKSKKAHFYMLIQEFGAGPHAIKPLNRKALAFNDVIVAGVTDPGHPGVPARPFMRPALDEKADEAVERTGAALRRLLGL